MGTFKRTPFEIDTTISNGSKFLNQIQFTGIVQNNNSFDVDQNSFTDALNVYVNDQNTLVSREPLVIDNLEIDYPSETAELIDIKEANNVKVFVFKDGETYTIIAHRDVTSISLTGISNYQLSIFNQYIICWNDLGAKIINTNDAELKWKPISEFAEIPITKIVTGPSEELFDKNQFTNNYIEQYNRKLNLNTILPESSAEITAETKSNIITKLSNLDKPWLNTDLTTIRDISNICNGDSVSFAINKTTGKYIICCGNDETVNISYDGGQSFITVYTPDQNTTGRSISDDGDYYFMIGKTCVYRLDLDTLNWSKVTIYDNSNIAGDIRGWHYMNGDNFCFFSHLTGSDWTTDTSETRKIRVYYLGHNLYTNSSITDKISYSDLNVPKYALLGGTGGAVNAMQQRNNIKMCYNSVLKTANIVLILPGQNNGPDDKYSWNAGRIYGIFGKENSAPIIYNSNFSAETNCFIAGAESINEASEATAGATVNGIKFYGTKKIGDLTTQTFAYYYYEDAQIWLEDNSKQGSSFGTAKLIAHDADENGFPYYVTPTLFINERGFKAYYYDKNTNSFKTQLLPDINGNTMQHWPTSYLSDFVYFIANGKYIFTETIYKNGKNMYYCFTNILTNDDVTSYYYHVSVESNYTKVPSITYSGSELFLGFDNTLMITKNTKDDENILFNLPKINNQSFASNIKSMINISTTELAIFFENGITICSKVADDLTGYRYAYAKTRLTLGTKFGDSVINTADGASTLYATPRGLAIMNYQAYMATTDQTLQFISDKIYDIWNKFYLSSENITLVQHGDYVFVYNTTNKYLMLDLRNASWWKFEIPYNIKKILTDQVDLRVIADKLYKFKKIDNGTDKIEDDYIDNKYRDPGDETINWRFMSQRLHFGLPNHYKNMKQIIFHMVQSTGHLSTFATQIKLYRNSVNYKDMEVIPFDFNFYVDEFRTFVKRFNYWKINMLQYGIANDNKTAIPARLVLNGIGVKYEIGDEVR